MTLNSYISTKYKDDLSNLNLENSVLLSNSLFNTLENATIKNVKLVFNDVCSFGTSTANIVPDFGIVSRLATNCTISNCSVNMSGEINLFRSFGGIIYESVNSTIVGNSFEMIGNVNVRGSNAGGIVGRSTNSIVAFNNNGLTGNIRSSNVVGGILGLSQTTSNEIYGNINNMLGNLGMSNITTTSTSSIGGIVGRSILGDNIIINMNAMEGDLLDSKSNCGGISGESKGNMKYNFNSMIGTINGSGIVNICNGTVKYNLNNMKGICNKSAGISNIIAGTLNDISNNYIAMNGSEGSTELTNASSGTSNYGFSNNCNLLLQDITIALPLDNYLTYIDNFDLPLINESQYNTVIRNKNLIGPAPYWGLYYPNNSKSNNTIITKSQLYRYNSNLVVNSNEQKFYSDTINSSITSNLLNEGNINVFPLKLYKYRGSNTKDVYKNILSNLLVSKSNNLKTYTEACYYNTLSNNIDQKGKSNIYLDDIFTLAESASSTDKDAIKVALTTNFKNGDKITLLNKDILYKRKPINTNNRINFERKNKMYIASSNILTANAVSDVTKDILLNDSTLFVTSNLASFNLTLGTLNLNLNTLTADSNYISIRY